MAIINHTHTVDIRGPICPGELLLIARDIEYLVPEGAVIIVNVDKSVNKVSLLSAWQDGEKDGDD